VRACQPEDIGNVKEYRAYYGCRKHYVCVTAARRRHRVPKQESLRADRAVRLGQQQEPVRALRGRRARIARQARASKYVGGKWTTTIAVDADNGRALIVQVEGLTA
jgi:hypothetical protein